MVSCVCVLEETCRTFRVVTVPFLACVCMDVDSEEDKGMVCSFCGGECEGVLHTHCIHEHGILRNFKK